MLLCMLIGIVVVFLEGAQASLRIEGKMIAICLLAGICNAMFLIGWILAIRKNSMVTMDVALTLGAILPAVLCAILFHEPISFPKLVGFALIIAAAAILAGYNKNTKGNPGIGGILLVVIASVGEGLVSFSQQLYKQYYTEGGSLTGKTLYPKSIYNFYIYVFAAATLILALIAYDIYRCIKNPTIRWVDEVKTGVKLLIVPLPYIVIMAVSMFAATYFQTVATGDYGMSSQVLYPLIKGGCLITVNIVAMLFFGEKATKRSILGSAVALVGVVVMNVV
jgi:drug/metabolite transporter (DMT)-like permease